MCQALIYLLDYIFIRFCTKLYRQIVGIPMGTGTNCAPVIADLFYYAMKGILWPLFRIIKKLKLFKHLLYI